LSIKWKIGGKQRGMGRMEREEEGQWKKEKKSTGRKWRIGEKLVRTEVRKSREMEGEG